MAVNGKGSAGINDGGRGIPGRKDPDEQELERLAIESLLEDARRRKSRAEKVGPMGWVKTRNVNKRFLNSLVLQTLSRPTLNRGSGGRGRGSSHGARGRNERDRSHDESRGCYKGKNPREDGDTLSHDRAKRCHERTAIMRVESRGHHDRDSDTLSHNREDSSRKRCKIAEEFCSRTSCTKGDEGLPPRGASRSETHTRRERVGTRHPSLTVTKLHLQVADQR